MAINWIHLAQCFWQTICKKYPTTSQLLYQIRGPYVSHVRSSAINQNLQDFGHVDDGFIEISLFLLLCCLELCLVRDRLDSRTGWGTMGTVGCLNGVLMVTRSPPSCDVQSSIWCSNIIVRLVIIVFIIIIIIIIIITLSERRHHNYAHKTKQHQPKHLRI